MINEINENNNQIIPIKYSIFLGKNKAYFLDNLKKLIYHI